MPILRTEKPYLLRYEVRPAYLYVFVRCDNLTYSIARAYWDEIIDLQAETGSSHILLEKEICAEMTAVDVYRIGAELARSTLRGVKVAVYDPNTSQTIRKLGENVWMNRALHGRVFDDLNEAENWLCM